MCSDERLRGAFRVTLEGDVVDDGESFTHSISDRTDPEEYPALAAFLAHGDSESSDVVFVHLHPQDSPIYLAFALRGGMNVDDVIDVSALFTPPEPRFPQDWTPFGLTSLPAGVDAAIEASLRGDELVETGDGLLQYPRFPADSVSGTFRVIALEPLQLEADITLHFETGEEVRATGRLEFGTDHQEYHCS